MIKKYLAEKSSPLTHKDKHSWSLHKLDPNTRTYHPEGKKRMSLGQLLCYIGGDDLESWKFIKFDEPMDGHLATLYRYLPPNTENEEIELAVVDNSQPTTSRNANASECEFNEEDSCKSKQNR